jgi:hypothetical protein
MKRFVAYHQDEDNGYDDSDFYIMILDTKEEKIYKHVYGSTRFANAIPFQYEYEDLTSDSGRYEYLEKALEIAKKIVNETITKVQVGDIVKVTNPRVKSFKGEIFKVETLRDFRLRYGRVVSTTLYGKNDDGVAIKTSESNVSIIKHSDSKLYEEAYKIVVGYKK